MQANKAFYFEQMQAAVAELSHTAMRSLQSPSLSVSPDNVHLFNSNLGAYMDFEQLVINQPQKCAIALEFEISGSVNCEWCSQLAQTVASFVEQLLHLTHPSVKINYSICASAKKTPPPFSYLLCKKVKVAIAQLQHEGAINF